MKSDMDVNNLRYKYNDSTNIRDLPGKIMLELRRKLDTGSHDFNWRAFVSMLSRQFEFRQLQVEEIGMKVYENDSPSQQMLLLLGGKGFNLKNLVEILLQMKTESILLTLVHNVPITITEQPVGCVEVTEGNQLVLTVKAYGLPYPRFQWFLYDDEVPGATESQLTTTSTRMADEGNYCCRLHNPYDMTEVIFTRTTQVKVIPLPVYFDKNSPNVQGPYVPKPSSNVPSFPVIHHHPSSKSVYEGRTFTLECGASGNLPLHYLWYHDNHYYTETVTPFLQIDNASENHGGVYHCIVKNNFSEARSTPATIYIEGAKFPCPAESPVIVTQPKSCIVEVGGIACFSMKVRGSHPLTYRWYKNDEPIPGANSSELKITEVTPDNIGSYNCSVRNEMGSKLSDGAVLQVKYINSTLAEVHTATDKVALLIGNYEYRCEDILKAPKTDIQNLSENFSILGFKVVSLLNLTLIEMKNAVDNFCDLLGPGVYGVFYFCGHGFEERKEIYLVPQDAPTGYLTNHCLRADFVQSRMQLKQPQISCLILDVCRTPNKITSPDVGKQDDIEVVSSANTILLYATSEGNQAYEYSSCGLLVKYLQQYLPKILSIEEVIAKVREEFGRADLPGNKIQNPQIKSNLTQTSRSFHDKINYRGHTQVFTRRQLEWEQCHITPRDMVFNALPHSLGVELELNFQRDFSNVLTIFVTVKNPGRTKKCLAWVGKHPNTISTMEGTPKEVTDYNECTKTKNTLQDMQKLKDKLEVSIYIKYSLDGQDNLISDKTVIVLGLPLVARLFLWREVRYPITYRREAMEQDDNMG